MKIVIGLDINEYWVQISYAKEGAEPQTLELTQQGDKLNIETALCKRHEVNQWYIGREAVQKALSGMGEMVEHLWNLLEKEEFVELEGNQFKVSQLCNLFLKKVITYALGLIEAQTGEEIEVQAMELTAHPWNENILAKLEEVIADLPVAAENVYFQGHEESLFSYLVHQPQRLMGYETAVMDLTQETLISYRVSMNHKTKPIVTYIETQTVPAIVRKKHYPSIMEHDRALAQLDQDFCQYIDLFTKDCIITSIYLIGNGFEGGWYQNSLKQLCRNRKVFAGNNLYSKGACYSAAERIWPGEVSEEFFFLGKDMLQYNIGLMLIDQKAPVYYPLLDAGTNWYEAHAQIEFMMDKADSIHLKITPLKDGKPYEEILELGKSAQRPERTWRKKLMIDMRSDREMHIVIEDEGFGDFYSPLKENMEYSRFLSEVKEENE